MGAQQHILVVDDNESICATLTELLGDEGYLVTAVLDGAAAHEALAQNDYNLALLDLVLPDTTGIEILRVIRGACPDTDAIMMTSNASLESATEALRLGAKDYLLKPFESLDMVLRVVNRAIENRRLIDENVMLYQQVISKSERLEQAVKRLCLLNEIANALHSMNELKDLLQLLIQSIAMELGAERATLMLVDPEQHSLTIEAFVGIDEKLAESVRVPIGQGISGWVAQEGQTLFSENISNDPRFKKNAERCYQSDSFISAPMLLSVPILLKKEVIGVINLNNKIGGGFFTDDDAQLVTTVAGQVAVPIENARMVERLRVSEEHFRMLVTHTPDHLITMDRNLKYQMVINPQLGLSEQDMIGKTDHDILTKDDADKLTNVKQRVIDTGDTQYVETSLTTMKGDIEFFDGTLVPKFNSSRDIDGLFGYFRNVTEYRRVNEDLKRKNSEIEQFIYTVSHDLRSPLVTIKTFLGYLEQDISSADDDLIGKDIDFIRSAADRMESLLVELLEMARIGRETPNNEDLITFKELSAKALDAVAGQISTKNVEVRVCDSNLTLRGDCRRLLQIWQNLLENAVKYLGDQSAPFIEIGVETKDAETIYYFRDNGIGIAPEYHEKIFGIFEKLERESCGVGMGLTMVRNIVELFGGRVWVESEGKGRGSCFRFTLPKATSSM